MSNWQEQNRARAVIEQQQDQRHRETKKGQEWTESGLNQQWSLEAIIDIKGQMVAIVSQSPLGLEIWWAKWAATVAGAQSHDTVSTQ